MGAYEKLVPEVYRVLPEIQKRKAQQMIDHIMEEDRGALVREIRERRNKQMVRREPLPTSLRKLVEQRLKPIKEQELFINRTDLLNQLKRHYYTPLCDASRLGFRYSPEFGLVFDDSGDLHLQIKRDSLEILRQRKKFGTERASILEQVQRGRLN
mmetsp:Transcript_1749/g.3080  ORF Transcript_1749/g.3080 Transcript_1749/m.3080 type:complete len:155 (-) Transcript_1749:1869-2333(-)